MAQTPSTSGIKISTQNRTQNSQTVISEDDKLTLRSLDVVAKVAVVLKTESNGFLTVLENILALVDGKQIENRELTYNLVDSVMSNILSADVEELQLAKRHFQKLLSSKISKSLVIDDETLVHLDLVDETAVAYFFAGNLHLPDNTWKKVTIKKAKLSENTFIETEAAVLSQLKHKNVITCYGIHTARFELVLEYMDFWSLFSALKSINFTTINLLKFLYDVANGMEYVAEKQFVHRNLMTEFIYLNKKKQCKIGGFDFAVYVGNTNGVWVDRVNNFDCYRLPYESAVLSHFTTATDVWSMGILIWELFLFVENDARGKAMTETIDDCMIEMFFKKGAAPYFSLTRPTKCPEKLHLYAQKHLLRKKYMERDNFSAIKTKIKEIMDETNK